MERSTLLNNALVYGFATIVDAGDEVVELL